MNRKTTRQWWITGFGFVALWLMLLAPTGCARHSKAAAPADAPKVGLHDFYIFRGVNANANNGNAQLGPAQFGFPNMSTFGNPAQAPVPRPCNYRFQVTGVANDPPHVGDSGPVTGLPGFTATFDDNPPGHWTVTAPAADPAPATTVSAYAQANRAGNVVNGTQQNCH